MPQDCYLCFRVEPRGQWGPPGNGSIISIATFVFFFLAVFVPFFFATFVAFFLAALRSPDFLDFDLFLAICFSRLWGRDKVGTVGS